MRAERDERFCSSVCCETVDKKAWLAPPRNAPYVVKLPPCLARRKNGCVRPRKRVGIKKRGAQHIHPRGPEKVWRRHVAKKGRGGSTLLNEPQKKGGPQPQSETVANRGPQKPGVKIRVGSPFGPGPHPETFPD